MNQAGMEKIIEEQKAYFNQGKTLPVQTRVDALKKLYRALDTFEAEIYAALKEDLGKCREEAHLCEVGQVKSEISYMIRHTRRFAKRKTVPTPLGQFHAHSFTQPVPYGTVLIISPWNYPFLLTLSPLCNAIAAGNTAVIKPGAYSAASSLVLQKMIRYCFDEAFVAVVTGGREENSYLMKAPFDYIFFTGSQAVGREVMRSAAERLVPFTLELGGKNPCIVEKTANIPLAARRIVFGKLLNCGQTCVAPDYIYCDEQIKAQLLDELCLQVKAQLGEEPLTNASYGRIVNAYHFSRLCGLMNGEIVQGGRYAEESLQIEPTLLRGVRWEDPVMQEEIFGPILPVLTYQTMDEVIGRLRTLPSPLALYCFTEDRQVWERIISQCSFGGGCINDTVIHLSTSHMGFGGVGASGMGAYHGKTGFDTFSHNKNMVDKKTWFDLGIRYRPYSRWKSKLTRLFLR